MKNNKKRASLGNKQLALFALLACSVALAGCSSLPSWMGGKKKEPEKLEGARISVVPPDEALQPDSRLAGVAVSLPPTTANNEWTQHAGGFTAARGNLAGKGTFSSVSSVRAGEGNSFASVLVLPPVVGDGRVYAMDAAGYISAHDAGNIDKVLWTSDGAYEEDAPDSFGGGVAYDNGRLYAVSGRGQVVSIDAATGTVVWRKDLRVAFRSAPKVAGGKLFATTLDNQTYAIRADNGEVAWTQRGLTETTDFMKVVSPSLLGDTVIAPYSSGEIYALSASDGRELWSEALSGVRGVKSSALFSGIGGDPVIDGEIVFAVSTSGQCTAFHIADGQRIWERALSAINTPWLAGDYLYFLTSDNTLVALVKYNGAIRWSVRLPSFEDEEDKEGPILWKGPVMVDSALVLAGSHGQLMRVDASDGKVLTTTDIPESIHTAPVVAAGRMYLMGQDATLYSLE
jgi:outer membrane protein assembly factor BamB